MLAERIANEPDTSLHLPLPADPVAKQVAASIMSDPAAGLEDHLRASNANRRTLKRRFKSETRMSLGQWRRRARILAAVTMLAEGDNVTSRRLRWLRHAKFVRLGVPIRTRLTSSRILVGEGVYVHG